MKKFAKKIIGWPVAWALFWLGHFWSKPLEWSWPKMLNAEDEEYRWVSWYVNFWYYPYSRLMHGSVIVNDWGGLDLWQKADPSEYEDDEGEDSVPGESSQEQ